MALRVKKKLPAPCQLTGLVTYAGSAGVRRAARPSRLS